MRVDVVLCAEQVPAAPGGVAGSHAVVIDVLRATSTIARALASGCAGVLPVAELEQAAARARSLGALLGGERGGLAPSGFDLGNSPRSYDASACAGRLVVLSTTNGSRAIEACAGAASLQAGSLLNAEATARALVERRAERVLLVCAGRRGQVSADDAAAAGCIAGTLALRAAAEFGDAARLAIALFDAWRHDLHGLLLRCEAGRHLVSLGLQADLDDCVQVDSVPVVAERGPDGVFRRGRPR